ncbi:MAG: tetratricopeptide repeat protein [Treponema sp.]
MYNLGKVLLIAIGVCVNTGTALCVSTPNDSNKAGDKSLTQQGIAEQRLQFAEQLNALVQQQAWDKALALFDTLTDDEKKQPAIQNLKVAILISQGDIAQAESLAKQLESKNPRNIEVLHTLSMIAQAKNDTKMRATYLKKILAIDKNNIQALYEQGVDLYTQSNYKGAEALFLRILKNEPNHIESLIWLGKLYYLEKKLAEAEKCYLTALEHEADNSHAIAELARIYSETDRMAEAIKKITQAIALQPDSGHYWSDLGLYNVQIGRRQEAVDAFLKAAELLPDSHFVRIYLAGLYDDLGDKEAAIKYYREVIRLYPQYYFAYEGLGVLLYERKDWAGARAAFINALSYAPENRSYALMIPLCSYKQGNKAEAKKFTEQYIKTIKRDKNELDYFLCRLFLDFTGDAEVQQQLNKEKSETIKFRKSFYLAAFYQLTDKWTVAEKYYIDIQAVTVPSFFEYRLAVHELNNH